jgi:hypothetical protein
MIIMVIQSFSLSAEVPRKAGRRRILSIPLEIYQIKRDSAQKLERVPFIGLNSFE